MVALEDIGRGVLRGLVYPAIPLQRFAGYWLHEVGRDLRRQVAWLQGTALTHARWIGLDVHVHGELPRAGLVVANHVSYLDIVALSAVAGCAFVAKHEVAQWPLFGAYARLGATIFVDRERRTAVADVAEAMQRHLDAGIPLVLFPEGTSTNGTQVLPFHSSLLEPVVQVGCAVTACGIRYSVESGSVADEVAYWGKMSLGPHLLRLLRKRRIRVDLHFGSPRIHGGGRKELARDLHQEVVDLFSVGAPWRQRPAITSATAC